MVARRCWPAGRAWILAAGLVAALLIDFVGESRAGLESPPADFAVDVSQLTTSRQFSCVVQWLQAKEGVKWSGGMIARAWRSNGEPDVSAAINIKNALAAGIAAGLDVYMFPCPKCNMSMRDQAEAMLEHLEDTAFGRVWIDVEDKDLWMDDCGKNMELFEHLAARLLTLVGSELRLGVYSSSEQWQEIMCNRTTVVSNMGLPLWYARYDNDTSFDDFVPFGGWARPYMKQFRANVSVCGGNFDISSRFNHKAEPIP